MRAAFVSLLVAAAPVLAQPVYSWTDADGVQHFSDEPSAGPDGGRVRRVPFAEEPPPKVPPPREERQTAARGDAGRSVGSATAASVAVDPPPHPQTVQQQIPDGLRQLWRLAIPHLRGPPSGPAFVELAETTTDPKVLAVALHALSSLYTSRTAVTQYTFEGKPYPALPADDRVFQLGLKYLDHPDKFVRAGGARLVGLGIARMPPSEPLIKAIAQRFTAETDQGVREHLLQTIWTCHCARRPMADMAIWFAEQKDPRLRLHGLTVMRKVGKKGRDFDADMRGQMRRAAEASFSHPAADVRAAAEAAAKACAGTK